jgi:hypothetical protein
VSKRGIWAGVKDATRIDRASVTLAPWLAAVTIASIGWPGVERASVDRTGIERTGIENRLTDTTNPRRANDRRR